jgi:WD40 repeat protein
VAFSPDSRWLASGGKDRQVRIWKVQTGNELPVKLRLRHPVKALAWSADGKQLAAAGWGEGFDAGTMIWEVPSGQQKRDLPWSDKTGTPRNADVRSLAFSPNGKWLAGGGGPLRVWSTDGFGPNGAEYPWQKTIPSYLYAVAFFPDSTTVAAACYETPGDNIRIWNLPGQADPKVLIGIEKSFGLSHDLFVGALAFSGDGKFLARATSDGSNKTTGSLTLWDVKLPEKEFSWNDTLELPGGNIYTLAMFRDGNMIVACAQGQSDFRRPGQSWSSIVKLWELKTKEVHLVETGHRKAIAGLALSPNGRLLATASEDYTVRLWTIGEAKKSE